MSRNMQIKVVETKIHSGQKPGTSGLRKKVSVFQQPHYLENFIQSIFNYVLNGPDGRNGITLVVGGDGRYFMKDAIRVIVQMASGNHLKKLIIGKYGILSTPAASHLIRKYKAHGGILLTASHNPGGPDHDFGVKFNTCCGGPAPERVTNQIYEYTTTLKSYAIAPEVAVDLTKLGIQNFNVEGKALEVEIIDPVEDYLALMKTIFDFPKLKNLIQGHEQRSPFKILIESMNGVTGPYVKRIFLDELGADVDSVVNIIPLEDFGGGHPDPNLTYAKGLVNSMKVDSYNFGAAFDGDGDRNMILGENAFFVNPSDSLAVIADNTDSIPYFKINGVQGYARSMPTGSAVDRVAEKKGICIYEVPTGWKFFSNLMSAQKISLCGEESFGTGSVHVKEKDGIWAVLAWLSIIEDKKMSVHEILNNHWKKYGRNYFTRHDYEDCDSSKAAEVVAELKSIITTHRYDDKELNLNGIVYKIKKVDNYSYFDPTDQTLSENNGIRFLFEDGSRIIFRCSGTGSSGTTIRLYVETYVGDFQKCCLDPQIVLKPLLEFALSVSKLEEFTGRKAPTVIT